MMGMQHNTAYNYEIPAAEPKVKQPPELKLLKRRQAADIRASFKALGVFVVSLMVVAAMIYNNVILTELADEIDTYQSQYEVLKSENKRMQVELEGKVSLRNIEEKATVALGMAQMEPYQVEYVDLSGGDQVVVADKAPTGIFDRAKEMIQSFLEYLSM